jgi:putative intracellular protease/amidase
MDVLLVSRGLGKQALMNDEEVLWLIRNQADSGRVVFSVCTGALLCGAPGISPRYDPSFTNRSGLCGLWSTLTNAGNFRYSSNRAAGSTTREGG